MHTHVHTHTHTDEISFYQYLLAAESEADKNVAMQFARMSHQTEILLNVVTGLLENSIQEETTLSSKDSLKRLRAVRAIKIEKCMKEFDDSVTEAIRVNKNLGEQGEQYANQIRANHKKRMKQSRSSSQRIYERLHALFGITFAREHMSNSQRELDKLATWSENRSLNMKINSTTSRSESIKGIAHAIEDRVKAQLFQMEKRLTLQTQKSLFFRLEHRHMKLIRDASNKLFEAEIQSIKYITESVAAKSGDLTKLKCDVMSKLTEKIKAFVMEEMNAKNRDDLESIRVRHARVVDEFIASITRKSEFNKVNIKNMLASHIKSISQEAEMRIMKLRLKLKSDVERLRMLYGDDVARDYEEDAKRRENFELRDKFESDKQILSVVIQLMKKSGGLF